MPISNKEIQDILNKYKAKLDKRVTLDEVEEYQPDPEFSKEYSKFREEALGKGFTRYEKLCNFSESIVKVNPSDKDIEKIEKSIDISHLAITPVGAASFAILVSTLLVLIGLVIGGVSYFLTDRFGIVFVALLLILVSVLLIGPLTRLPNYIAGRWRLDASNQMVLCILYIVIYMRHTSNLENAIKFASDHLSGSLSLDLRKIFWDVQTSKYSTLKESLESYLGKWREHNLEFVNSFHLIESSLYEPSEGRRTELLDKSLKTILDGIYEKMLHYAHDLKNPITMLHMLGVILPILGLVMFPLIGVFLGSVKWYHLAILYNVLLPLLVYSVGVNILNKRPGSYGQVKVPFKSKKGVAFTAIIISLFFLIIGASPFILHEINPGFDITFWSNSDGSGGEKFLDFECNNSGCVGPFGLGALLIGLFIPLGFAISLWMYFNSKTKKAMKLRKETKRLESEFATALFQLGTRIGDGIPSELAFKDVAKTMSGTPAGKFFGKVHLNLVKGGMSLKEAIFNPENGAYLDYPSPLVQSSMEVLLESSRKGPKIVAQSLTSISQYVGNVHKVNERLKDLLAEIISSMQSQIKFMAPVISGIVVGISSMIVGVISKLSNLLDQVNAGDVSAGFDVSTVADMFSKTDAIPGYWFQVVVGVYVIQIIYILSVLVNGIEFGVDKLNEQNSAGKNILKGTLIYLAIALIGILLFNYIASQVLTTSSNMI
ncbi:hypothetical protein K8R33_03760 [archaeon]|nr:hypothetical protein [archaeon]